MASLISLSTRRFVRPVFSRMLATSGIPDPGSGAGKGGGSGGDIRSAGGAFAKMEVAHEEQYFRKLQAEQLANLKRQHQQQAVYHDEEIKFHEDAIQRHHEAIERHKVMKTQHEAEVRHSEDAEKESIKEQRRNGSQ